MNVLVGSGPAATGWTWSKWKMCCRYFAGLGSSVRFGKYASYEVQVSIGQTWTDTAVFFHVILNYVHVVASSHVSIWAHNWCFSWLLSLSYMPTWTMYWCGFLWSRTWSCCCRADVMCHTLIAQVRVLFETRSRPASEHWAPSNQLWSEI